MNYFTEGSLAVADLLLQLAPYVLIGILLSELLKYTKWSSLIGDFVGLNLGISIFLASILGILSPLATYGTVPIIVELNRKGLKPAVLITFLTASALMNPQLFVLTYGALGDSVAFIRLGAVFIFTMLQGFGVNFLFNQYKLKLKEPSDLLIHHKSSNVEKSWHDFSIRSFVRSYIGNLEYMGYYIVLGTVLSVAFRMIMPELTFLANQSNSGFIGVIGAAFVGVPLYVCGGAVIPFVQNLMANGLSTGAVIAFFVVGPATRILPLTAISMFFNRKMMIGYIMSLFAFAISLGIIINLMV